MDFIKTALQQMETIYTLTGWVRKVIDNEHTKTLNEIRTDAVGNVGKDTLVKIATEYMEMWKNLYSNKKRKYPIACACSVYSNKVTDGNCIMVRDRTIFVKVVKTKNQE